MKLGKKEQLLFGLSEREVVILNTLEKGTSSVSELARDIPIPRTTIHFLLGKLLERGFVETTNKLWTKTDTAEHSLKLKNILEGKNYPNIFHSDSNTKLKIYSGIHEIKKSYQKMLAVGKSNRVYAIQGTHSAEEAGTLPSEFFYDIHQKMKDKEVIMECIEGRSVLTILKKMKKDELVSHLNRIVIMYLVPDEHLRFNLDIIIFEDQVLFINISEKEVIHMVNETIASSFRILFQMIASGAEKIDSNAYIRQLLEEKTKR